jgi:hypothetical protein
MKDDSEDLFARRITQKNADMKLKASPLWFCVIRRHLRAKKIGAKV